jgi:hypothetical protein
VRPRHLACSLLRGATASVSRDDKIEIPDGREGADHGKHRGAEVIQPKGQIDGVCSDRFATVRDAFAYNLASGQDIGASVAIFVDGELVVDLWGGYCDATYTRPWGRDTIAQGLLVHEDGRRALCAPAGQSG